MFLFNVRMPQRLRKVIVPQLSRLSCVQCSSPFSSSMRKDSLEDIESTQVESSKYRNYQELLQGRASDDLKVESHSVTNQAQQLEDNNSYSLDDRD